MMPYQTIPSAVFSERQITWTEQKHPDSVLIILGDFNKANLSHEMPKYT